MRIRERVMRFLSHTRFVPTPVYRLMVLAWTISGVLQIIYGPPNTVQTTSATGETSWFNLIFVLCQLAASALVFIGLYFVKENSKAFVTVDEADKYVARLRISLTLELIGIIGLQTVIAVQVASSAFYQSRIPSAGTTWMAIIFAAWCGFRQRDIILAQRKLAP